MLERPDGDQIRRDLGIPEGYVHATCVALGYEGRETSAPLPRKPGLVN